ncbi:MAG: hypothetical protein AB1441_01725 [Bacillota bacterium]
MGKVDEYRNRLKSLADWKPFLLAESGLPGKRANLELLEAVAAEGTRELFLELAAFTPEKASADSPHEFLAACGVAGLGKLIAWGDTGLLPELRRHAPDPRWRVRESVAIALQYIGDADMDFLLREMDGWSRGSLYEQRAAAAGLCEPRLLAERKHAMAVLALLDRITAGLITVEDRTSPGFSILRKALGYCWSVAVTALPAPGKELMEKWFSSRDKDILWIMRENLKKQRLTRLDAEWVRKAQQRLGKSGNESEP